ncbi:hypothetical protein FQR65_LT17338 [Abscondita terminalis]|nr:hypothetical protein FQR65_LT17338 [Abscondita terminalis]
MDLEAVAYVRKMIQKYYNRLYLIQRVYNMKNLKLKTDPKVNDKFNNYPELIREKMQFLRELVIETAGETHGVRRIGRNSKMGRTQLHYQKWKYTSNGLERKIISKANYAMYFQVAAVLGRYLSMVFGELPIEVEDLEIEIEGLNKRAAKFSSEIKDLQDQIKAKKEAGSHAQNLIEKYKSQQDNPFGGAEDFVWSPDSSQLLYVTKEKYGAEYAQSTNTDIFAYNLASGQTENLTKGMMGYDVSPKFSPDGKYLTWQSMRTDGYEADKNDIVIMDWKTKKKTNLTQNWER